MMSRIRSAITAASYVAAVGFVPVASAQETRDVSALAVTIASVEPVGKWDRNAIVTLKVANRGKAAAEPLTFAVTAKDGGEAVVMRRVPGPYTGRAGRPVPPGGTQTYQVLFPGEHARLAGAKAKVVDASFPSTAPPADVPVQIGTPRTEKRKHEMGATVEFAVLPLKNLMDAKLDVTVRATFEKPSAATVLIHRRLKPKEEIEATFTDLVCDPPPEIAVEDPGWSVDFVVPKGAKIAKAAVVDWCLVGTGDAADAAKLLKDAYARWLRWETRVGISGTYAAAVRGKAGTARQSRGKFSVGADGAISVRSDGAPPEDAARIKSAVQDAFRDLQRPPAEEAVALLEPQLDKLGPPVVIACHGEGWNKGEYRRARFAIAEGRIVGDTWYGGSPNDVHREWLLESFEGGYVVGERRAFNIGGRGKPTEVQRWRYGRFDGLLVPLKYSVSEDLTPVGEAWSLEIAFEDVRRDAAAAKPVASAATEAVRAAWNTGYRYPGTKVSFSCRMTAKAGKDGLWRGVKEVRGRCQFTDFDGRARGRAGIVIEGVKDESLRDTLTFTIDDRFGMWSGRDFGLRGDFDAVFAGASFAERGEGVYDVTNGPYRSVTVKDGRIAALAYLDGTPRTLTWTKVGDHDVVTRIVTGPEVLTSTFTPVGALLVPTHMVFKGVFGNEKEWGTEELILSDFVAK